MWMENTYSTANKKGTNYVPGNYSSIYFEALLSSTKFDLYIGCR